MAEADNRDKVSSLPATQAWELKTDAQEPSLEVTIPHSNFVKLEQREVRRRLNAAGLDFIPDEIDHAEDPHAEIVKHLKQDAGILQMTRNSELWSVETIAKLSLVEHPQRVIFQLPDKRRVLLIDTFAGSERQGANGFVCRARIEGSDQDYILKSMLRFDSVLEERFIREANHMHKVGPPAAPELETWTDQKGKLHTSFDDNGIRRILMKLIPGIQLGKLLQAAQGQGLPVRFVLYIAEQCARVIAQAHGQGVIHRDVKEFNMFLKDKISEEQSDDSGVIALDWGLSTVNDTQDEISLTQSKETLGTDFCEAPEIIANSKATSTKMDMYSLGRMFYRLAAGKDVLLPKEERARRRLRESLMDVGNDANQAAQLLRELKNIDEAIQRRVKSLSAFYPKEFVDLLSDLLSSDPDQRPAAAQAERQIRNMRKQEPKLEINPESISENFLQMSGHGTKPEEAIEAFLEKIIQACGPLVEVPKEESNGHTPDRSLATRLPLGIDTNTGDGNRVDLTGRASNSEGVVLAKQKKSPRNKLIAAGGVLTGISAVALLIWAIMAKKHEHDPKVKEKENISAKTNGDAKKEPRIPEVMDKSFTMIFDPKTFDLEIKGTESGRTVLRKGPENMLKFLDAEKNVRMLGIPLSKDGEYQDLLKSVAEITIPHKKGFSQLCYLTFAQNEPIILDPGNGFCIADSNTGTIKFDRPDALKTNQKHPGLLALKKRIDEIQKNPLVEIEVGANLSESAHEGNTKKKVLANTMRIYTVTMPKLLGIQTSPPVEKEKSGKKELKTSLLHDRPRNLPNGDRVAMDPMSHAFENLQSRVDKLLSQQVPIAHRRHAVPSSPKYIRGHGYR